MRKLINKVKYFGKTLVNESVETNEEETPLFCHYRVN